MREWGGDRYTLHGWTLGTCWGRAMYASNGQFFFWQTGKEKCVPDYRRVLRKMVELGMPCTLRERHETNAIAWYMAVWEINSTLRVILAYLCLNNCSESLIQSRLKPTIIYSAHRPAVGKGLGIVYVRSLCTVLCSMTGIPGAHNRWLNASAVLHMVCFLLGQ